VWGTGREKRPEKGNRRLKVTRNHLETARKGTNQSDAGNVTQALIFKPIGVGRKSWEAGSAP